MNKEKIVTAYVEQISRFVTEEELDIILKSIEIVDRVGVKLYTSVMLDNLGEAETEDE